jgi:hypothetical protein
VTSPPPPPPPAGPGPLFPLRTALVLLFAVVVGAGAGGLTYLSTTSVTAAVLAGFAAFGAALALFDRMIGP